jgi:mono/diheme cytochrome c family protein
MTRGLPALVALAFILGCALRAEPGSLVPSIRAQRGAPTDLEVSGPFPGGVDRGFIARERLLALPLVVVTNTLDQPRKAPAVYRGIPLKTLRSLLGLDGSAADTIFAVCSDGYSKEFPADYLDAFQSILILEIDGMGPESWGRSKLSGLLMAPFYINAADFKPRADQTVLGRPEPLHFPYSVVRLEFRTAAATLDRIRLPRDASPLARQGQEIALRECLSCHGHDDFGGTLSGRPWLLIRTWASNTNYFRRYVVNPKSVQPTSKMPPFADLTPQVLDALQAYFRELRVAPRPR